MTTVFDHGSAFDACLPVLNQCLARVEPVPFGPYLTILGPPGGGWRGSDELREHVEEVPRAEPAGRPKTGQGEVVKARPRLDQP